ncbi:MAG: competence/damage-inducible protein A [Gammaproteobacteria bacterium]|nr:competence/damage-inducible protein A [Gammaproteobacteria bacterium]MYB37421.1 competence/damage-inducible protein A [Gammaproteobacteria bacterium]
MSERIYTACVLIIGNEILSGRTQDTNLQHIALVLGEQGVRVREARVIADVEEEIVSAVNEARAKFDYVLTTGGIGPTHDDITADCIAKAFGVPLVVSEEIAAVIGQRPAPAEVMESRMLMARIPEGADLIDNPTGGPQGFCIGNVYVMAGIPSVMQGMLSTIPFAGGSVVRSCSVTAFLGESQVATGLAVLQEQHPDVDIGSYPFSRDGRYGTTLVIRGTDTEVLNEVLDAVAGLIRAGGEEPVDMKRA